MGKACYSLTIFPILFLSLSLLPLASVSQVYPRLNWQKFYGKRGNETAACIEKSADGYLFLGGTTEENDGQGPCSNMWIVKVDEEGNMLWDREIGGSGYEELRDMTATPDGGVVFVGVSGSFIQHLEKGENDFQGDYFIGKVDANGDLVWIQSIGGLDIDQATTICPVGEGHFMIGGASASHSFDVETELGMTNLWVPRLDAEGNKIIGISFGGRRHDFANGSWHCKNGDVVFAGFTDSEDIDGSQKRENGDGWVVRTDEFGNLKWQNIFSGKFEDYFNDITEDSEGRLLLAGTFESDDKGKQFWLLKITAEGKRVQEKIFGDRQDEFLTSVATCADGGILLGGYSSYLSLDNPYVKGGDDLWLIRLDSKTNLIWRACYGGPEDERGVEAIEWEPGVYYVIGTKYNDFYNNGTYDKKNDMWLLRVTEERCEDVTAQFQLSIKDNTAYANRSFKCRAVVSKGESFIWDFGDGTTSTEKEPTHMYTLPGIYEIKLTVILNENCSKTIKYPAPVMVW